MTTILDLLRNDRGATTIEYAAIASLVSIAAIGVVATIGVSVGGLFTSVPAF